ncbi:MAG: virulence protein SciE type [Thiohalocapsa sp.]|jgi:type VI secretion system protein ImpE|uniref:type VI secretion system accessory protein TagJ n=1 Tax=Thiohalocapsa sp. TaxID=2497641 RepID=UPI0025DCD256|nr:type VI secretion system accessory protein TagJ [Thiohalocapsa sp.]MCG6942509.1 virulence protein SciE type [Thiohalocapsa sp.]
MNAAEALREGKLVEALALLQDQVRGNPSEAKHRTFLFQLLALLGQWDRALKQLRVAGELDAGTLAMVQTYREALQCEVFRAEVFAGKRTPLIFGEPKPWIALLLQAQRLLAEGAATQAAEVGAEALDQAPATAGEIDGETFAWITDGDTRLGPMLELILNGRYYWVPFEHIQEIRLDPPEDLRDLIWMPAQMTWANGGETVALIPSRYPGSERSDDTDIVRARKTEWTEQEPDTFLGSGQRMLFTDQGEYALFDTRVVTLRPSIDDEAPAEADLA